MAHEQQYLSPNQKAWRRLRRNVPAMGGIIVISLAILVALFAFWLVPDSTPSANQQVLEIATQSPGFKVQMLKMRLNRHFDEANFLEHTLHGSETPYRLVPIEGYELQGANIIVQPYSGGSSSGLEKDTISLADVLFPLEANPKILVDNQSLRFTDLNGKQQNHTIADLQAQAKGGNLITKKYWLGTDKFGRDTLSRLILGIRVSLSVGLVAVIISLFIGVTLGATAGYFRGWVDDAIMWVINVFWPIPTLLLVFALVITLGRDFWQIYLAVGLTMWVELARVVRGQFLSLREENYVEAAHSLGFGNPRIIFRHILPNTIGAIVVITAANFATAIIIEAGLSFLGIGVRPPTPSWGGMLKEYYSFVGTDKAFLALIPGTAILILVLAFNLIGNGLRDALDVKTK